MTTQEIRDGFDAMIAQATDADAVARLELLREWFTNPAFRAKLSDYVWTINSK